MKQPEKTELPEGEAVTELVKNGMDYYAALDSLRNSYKAAGREWTPEYIGSVIRYYKSKKKPEKQETLVEKMEKECAKRAWNEHKATEIINNYKRG